MSDLGNKEIMATNIKRQLDKKGITMTDLAVELNVPPTTVYGWCKGTSYPRIDKIEMMANYFGILKSALVEKRADPQTDMLNKLFNERPDMKDLIISAWKLPEEVVKHLTVMVKALQEEIDNEGR